MIRKQNNLTQRQVADAIGKSYQIYQTWENGTRNPKDENLTQLAKVFNVTYEYLTDTEILPIYQKLSDSSKAKVILFAQTQLDSETKKSTKS